MLSWDDLNDEGLVPAPVVGAALQRAVAEVEQSAAVRTVTVAAAPVLDTAALVAATRAVVAAVNAEARTEPREPMAPAAAAAAVSPVVRAQAAVARLDAREGEQELAGAAERVTVDQKRMINCRADLNQLVPFKYEWA
ncbi:MAG: hypothetical protein RLZZ169_1928, partial [Pseudomonadota bacterium]